MFSTGTRPFKYLFISTSSENYFVVMKQNNIVRSHQHRMGMHLGTLLACSFCTTIMNQIREHIVHKLVLNNVQRIFWLLFSFTFIKKHSKFFICVLPRATPRQEQSLVFFNSVSNNMVYMYCCHNESSQYRHNQYTHTFPCICQSSFPLIVASFL